MASPEPAPFSGLIDFAPAQEESCGSYPPLGRGQLPLVWGGPPPPPRRPVPRLLTAMNELRPVPPLLMGRKLHRQGGQWLIGK